MKNESKKRKFQYTHILKISDCVLRGIKNYNTECGWKKGWYVAKARKAIILRTLQPETRGKAFNFSSFVTLSVRSKEKK